VPAVRSHVLTLGLALLGVAGCMRVAIDSHREFDDSGRAQRVFVFSVVGSLRQAPDEEFSAFAEAFARSITAGLAANGVTADVATVSRLDLDATAHSDRFKTFSPDFVLIVAPVRRVLRVGTYYLVHPDTLTFDASLYDRASNKRWWNAQVTIDRPTFSSGWDKGEADALAAAIIKHLQEDGLV